MENTVLSAIERLLVDNVYLGKIGQYSGVGNGVDATITQDAFAALLHLAEIGVEAAMELVPLVV